MDCIIKLVIVHFDKSSPQIDTVAKGHSSYCGAVCFHPGVGEQKGNWSPPTINSDSSTGSSTRGHSWVTEFPGDGHKWPRWRKPRDGCMVRKRKAELGQEHGRGFTAQNTTVLTAPVGHTQQGPLGFGEKNDSWEPCGAQTLSLHPRFFPYFLSTTTASLLAEQPRCLLSWDIKSTWQATY